MTRSDALRDLYEALDLLDALQTGAPRPDPVPVAGYLPSARTETVVDLRDGSGPAGSAGPGSAGPGSAGTVLPPGPSTAVGGLRHQVRLRLGADWDATGRR